MFLQKIIMEKNKQFDNLMKYSITKDGEYLKKIEEFYHIIDEVDTAFKYGLFTNLLEEFNSCISEKKEDTLANILGLYARTYSKIEGLNEKLIDESNRNCEDIENRDYFFEGSKEILVIDDDVLLLKLIEKSMKARGYNVIVCAEPFHAIEILKERKISLVVLDIILPNTDGFQITKMIREKDPLLPIIIISEKDDLETKIKLLKIGADDYITKPIKKEEFYARIDRTLDRAINYSALAIEDGLTGVYTKEHFWDRASEKKALYDRNKKAFSIAFIDIDSFKRVNDNLGHLLGDQILKCFSQGLRETLRSTDLIFRFGGDEFIIVFPETGEIEAKLVMERFKREKNCKKCHKNGCITLSKLNFSAGITEIKDENDTIEKMIERADKALYKAKVMGGNKVLIYKDLNN